MIVKITTYIAEFDSTALLYKGKVGGDAHLPSAGFIFYAQKSANFYAQPNFYQKLYTYNV